METKEIRTIAATIVANTKSANEIKAQYEVLAEKYDKATARLIVDKARELRKKDQAKLEERRVNLVEIIDAKSLQWEFEGLLKEKDWKALAGRALCKCKNAVELVTRFYPHTILVTDAEGNTVGVPAGKKELAAGIKVWTVKSKYNAKAVLKACLKQVAKAAKGAKYGTTVHTEGELVPVKVK